MNELAAQRLASAILAAMGSVAEEAARRALEAKAKDPLEGMPDRLLLSVKDVAKLLSLGHAKVEQLVYSGELRSIKVDGSRRILAEALREFVDRLDHDQNAVFWQTKSETPSPRKLNVS